MGTEVVQFEPWVFPVIEFHGRYVVDLKHGYFRQLANPYEAIGFDSPKGRALCGATGIVMCQDCHTSVMIGVPSVGLRCMRCGCVIRGGPEVRERNQISLATAMIQEEHRTNDEMKV